VKPPPKRRAPTLANDCAWRVTARNHVLGASVTCDFRTKESAERYVELRKSSVTGRIGEDWMLQRRFGNLWLRADGKRK
jgi:hypothetical protein